MIYSDAFLINRSDLNLCFLSPQKWLKALFTVSTEVALVFVYCLHKSDVCLCLLSAQDWRKSLLPVSRDDVSLFPVSAGVT